MRILKNPMNGFKYALEGLVHVFRTQRHMRFHFLTLVLVLLVSLLFKLQRDEILVLLFTITLVLTAEMLNTAIEAIVDLVTQTYHPLAKFAKDIAAGAVLITTINALAVGFLLFFDGDKLKFAKEQIGFSAPSLQSMGVIAFILISVMIVMWKVAGGKGKLLKGGIVSGHSAVGFFLATTIMVMTRKDVAISFMAFMLAVLVAQSRVEGNIHTLREVIAGAILATSVAVIVYLVLGPVYGL